MLEQIVFKSENPDKTPVIDHPILEKRVPMYIEDPMEQPDWSIVPPGYLPDPEPAGERRGVYEIQL